MEITSSVQNNKVNQLLLKLRSGCKGTHTQFWSHLFLHLYCLHANHTICIISMGWSRQMSSHDFINGIVSQWLSGTCFTTTAHGQCKLVCHYHHCDQCQLWCIGEDEMLIILFVVTISNTIIVMAGGLFFMYITTPASTFSPLWPFGDQLSALTSPMNTHFLGELLLKWQLNFIPFGCAEQGRCQWWL